MNKAFVIITAALLIVSFEGPAAEAQGLFYPIRPTDIAYPAYGPIVYQPSLYQPSQQVVFYRAPVVQSSGFPLAANSLPVLADATRAPIIVSRQAVQGPAYYEPITVQRPMYLNPSATYATGSPVVYSSTSYPSVTVQRPIFPTPGITYPTAPINTPQLYSQPQPRSAPGFTLESEVPNQIQQRVDQIDMKIDLLIGEVSKLRQQGPAAGN